MAGTKLFLAATFLAALLLGCAPAVEQAPPQSAATAGLRVESGYREYTGFMPTTDRVLVAREPGCQVDVVLEGSPERAHVIVGMVTAERVGGALIEQGGGEEQAIAWLREGACGAGGHVIFGLDTSTDRHAYGGRSIRGRAIVAVYEGQQPAGSTEAPAPPPSPPASSGWGEPPPGATPAPVDFEIQTEDSL